MRRSTPRRGAALAVAASLLLPCAGLLLGAGAACAGPTPAWQPLGGAPGGLIGLADAQRPAPLVHGQERFIAMIEQRRVLVVYREFATRYGTASAWVREGGPLNRGVDARVTGPTLASIGGEVFAAWLEERDRRWRVMVARLRTDGRSRSRWEPVGDPIPAAPLGSAPKLVELDGATQLVFEGERRQARVARLAATGWQIAPTPITPPGSFEDVVAYRGAIYVLNRIEGGTQLIDMVARATPTADGDVRVESLGQVSAAGGARLPRLAAGPASVDDGRPVVAVAHAGEIVIRQLTQDGRDFAIVARILAAPYTRVEGTPLLVALRHEILVGVPTRDTLGNCGVALRIYRLGAAPDLPLLGRADPPDRPYGSPALVAGRLDDTVMLAYERDDHRAGALLLRL